MTLEDAPPDTVSAIPEPPSTTPTGAAFVERAQQMVAFLAQRDRGATDAAQKPEQALADWISRWRRVPRRGLDATQHFVAEELGIIVRALNGPAEGTTRLRDVRTDDLCWLIARCISHGS